MSTLKVDNIRHNSATSDAITMASDGTCTAKITSIGGGQLSHRNIIINGAHAISQRGTAAVTVTTSAGYRSVDRYKSDIDGGGGGDWSHAQSTDVPAGQGFRNSSKITTVTQASQPTSTSVRNQFYTQFEKQDVYHLEWGTSAAKTCTLSFWVKSSVAGIYPVWFQHYSSGGNKYYYSNYTINATNTWEKKTVTVTGSTSGGNVSLSNSVGFRIEWGIGYGSDCETGTLNEWTTSSTIRAASGSVYLPENSGATWYLTGCQFEVGDTATSFEHRSYAEELQRCQRYFQFVEQAHAIAQNSTNTGLVSGLFTCEMRAAPTIGTMNISTKATNVGLNLQGDGTVNVTQSSGNQGTSYSSQRSMVLYDISGFNGMTSGRSYFVGVPANNGVVFTADAEL